MKSTVFALGLGAGLVLAAGPALAGLCTAEIENLEKTLASADAGMGPAGSGADTAPDADTTVPGGTAQPEATPPAGVMNEAPDGNATSAEEAPTDSDAAEAGQMSTAAGIDEATGSLQRAKELDQRSDEAACMEEIAKAKGALGLQ